MEMVLETFLVNFAEFANNWKELNTEDLGNRLKGFFDKWQDHFDYSHLLKEVTSTKICADRIQAFMTEMAPLVNEIRDERKTGYATNVWSVARLGSDEVKVSSVLAWFLDCQAEHGQGSAILGRMLDLIQSRSNFEGWSWPSSETISKSRYWVNVESCPNGDRFSRVDIEIDGEKFLLFLEVKIFAPETDVQLDRYMNIGRCKSAGRPWGLIFLTCDGNGSKKSVNVNGSNNFACVSWKDIADIFKAHANTLPTCFSKAIMNQYAVHIQNFRRN